MIDNNIHRKMIFLFKSDVLAAIYTFILSIHTKSMIISLLVIYI